MVTNLDLVPIATSSALAWWTHGRHITTHTHTHTHSQAHTYYIATGDFVVVQIRWGSLRKCSEWVGVRGGETKKDVLEAETCTSPSSHTSSTYSLLFRFWVFYQHNQVTWTRTLNLQLNSHCDNSVVSWSLPQTPILHHYWKEDLQNVN